MEMLNVALPKGRLGEKVYAMFEAAGFEAVIFGDDAAGGAGWPAVFVIEPCFHIKFSGFIHCGVDT